MVGHPSKTNVMEAAAILMFGCVAILLNYIADLQKEKFRTSGGQCYIWGRPAKFVVSIILRFSNSLINLRRYLKSNYLLNILLILRFLIL